MRQCFTLDWDVKKIAAAMKIPYEEIIKFLQDGRTASFFVAARLAAEHNNWQRVKSQNHSLDLKDPQGKIWEVRSLTKNGVYFTPSSLVGVGRYFDKNKFLARLSEKHGFIILDITKAPIVEVIKIKTETVLQWWQENQLSANTRISKWKFYQLLNKKR